MDVPWKDLMVKMKEEPISLRLEDVLSAYRQGAKVRRKEWKAGKLLTEKSALLPVDLHADDWEIVPFTKRKAKLAPGLLKSNKFKHHYMSGFLYESEEQAREHAENMDETLVAWPAYDGLFVEVEIEE